MDLDVMKVYIVKSIALGYTMQRNQMCGLRLLTALAVYLVVTRLTRVVG